MKIESIKFVTKDGRELVLINGKFWVSLKQWLNAGGKRSQLLQCGWTLKIEFFKEGEELLNGKECTKSNTIIKTFSISPSATLVANLESEFAKFEAAAAFGVAVSTQQPVAAPVAAPAPKLEAPADVEVIETDVEDVVEADAE